MIKPLLSNTNYELSVHGKYYQKVFERGEIMDYQQLPIGLGLSLAMNQSAMDRFAKMTEAEKEQTIARSRNVKSKREMDRIVSSLAEDDDSELKNLFDGPCIL